MTRHYCFLVAAAVLGTLAIRAEPQAAGVKPFAVSDSDGKSVTLPARDATATVVVVLSFDCPVSKGYLEPLGELAQRTAGRGAKLVGVVPGESAGDVAKHAAAFKVSFPVYADPDLTAVAALSATRMPEAFVLDAAGTVSYRGRIDDGWLSPGKRNPRPAVPDLANALDAVLAGRPVAVARTTPVGCPVPTADKPAAAKPGAVTFTKDVLPILQSRCQDCHRSGGAGPFELVTYKQAVRWADLLVEYTADRRMPPWKPVGGPGYLHERTMPRAEIDTLASWVAAGTPEGDPKNAPPPKAFPGDGWALGPPDLVLEVPEDFHLGPTGPDHFRAFVLPTGLADDKMIVAYEVKPGTPQVVHHAINYFDTSGTARKLEQAERDRPKAAGEPDRGPGYRSPMGVGFTPPDPKQVGGIGGWTPGLGGFRLPAGTGYFLPKGADVVMQIHYHRDGKAAADRTKIGLYFATDTAGLKQLGLIVVPGVVTADGGFFSGIPAGRSGYGVRGRTELLQDATLYSILPHMHMLGRKVTVTMTPPGGPPRVLVDVPDWDYNWQEGYFFKEPIRAPAGTVFEVAAEFDNSDKNPHNPFSPPRAVKKGEQTTDEMLFGFIRATTDATPGPGVLKTRYVINPKEYAGGK